MFRLASPRLGDGVCSTFEFEESDALMTLISLIQGIAIIPLRSEQRFGPFADSVPARYFGKLPGTYVVVPRTAAARMRKDETDPVPRVCFVFC